MKCNCGNYGGGHNIYCPEVPEPAQGATLFYAIEMLAYESGSIIVFSDRDSALSFQKRENDLMNFFGEVTIIEGKELT